MATIEFNLKSVPKIKSDKELKKLLHDKEVHFIHCTDYETYAIDRLTYNRKQFLLLEPNPVTFYYSVASDLTQQFETIKQQLRKVLKTEKPNDISLAVIYSAIFRIGSIGVVFSLLAIEAFMNQELPDNGEIDFKNKKATKEEIQRWASFEDKLLRIIPKVSKKDFCRRYTRQGTQIREYKKLRRAYSLKAKKERWI